MTRSVWPTRAWLAKASNDERAAIHELEAQPSFAGDIREFYEVRAKRIEPVDLANLWPETN